jgi:homocitrate synthase NifV
VRQAYGRLGIVLDDDALTGRVLACIRDHAMRVKQEATPDELRSFLFASLERPLDHSGALVA